MSASQVIAAYTQPHQFEPLLPQQRLEELAIRTRAVVEQSFQLQGAAHPGTRGCLRELVRAMNSYYSNLIEGHSTHPRNIDRALRSDFSSSPDTARRQRLALAHIEAERELEPLAPTEDRALASAFLQEAHARLYRRLAPADLLTEAGQAVEPGQLRQQDVTVGRHHPPSGPSIAAFLHRADEVYARRWGLDQLLYAVAAAHHRMAWVHPFLDGNGRACRLQTHCALQSLTGGLWSPIRGMARHRSRYYELLSNADMARQGELDGRGNLSERMLWNWCSFFIELCEDQVSFMSQLLDLQHLKQRLAGLLAVRAQQPGGQDYRREALLPLLHVMAAGPVTRGEFIQMTGLAERTARKVLARLLQDGLLVSPTPKGEVGIGLPLDALAILMPNLYPEAATTPRDGD